MASNPVLIDCPKGEWTKVATDVVNGFLRLDQATDPEDVLQTHRLTGGAAPTLSKEGRQFSQKDLPIIATEGIDVYVWPLVRAISLRVDL
jgi:hypothetical protein